jgi:hypothetical protein
MILKKGKVNKPVWVSGIAVETYATQSQTISGMSEFPKQPDSAKPITPHTSYLILSNERISNDN